MTSVLLDLGLVLIESRTLLQLVVRDWGENITAGAHSSVNGSASGGISGMSASVTI